MSRFHPMFIAAALLGAALAVQAQTPAPAGHESHHPQPAASAAQQLPSEGEVRKLNLEAAKVTLRHGPIANLDMPPMTMVFTAAAPKLLEGLKEGDKVRFQAEKRDGAYFVTAIRKAE